MASGEQIWAQAWSEPEAGSDLASLTLDRAPRREPGRVGPQRPEDLVLARGVRRLGLRRLPLRPAGAAALGADLLPLPARRRGRHGATDRPTRRRARLRRDLPLRRLRPRRRRAVRRRPGTGWRVAMSTASNERGLSLRTPGRFSPPSTDCRPVRERTTTRVPRPSPGCRRLGRGPGLPAQHMGHRHPSRRRWQSAPRPRSTRSSGPSATSPPHETALDLLGPGVRAGLDNWLDGYLFSLSGPIYAGTNEIQRNIVAERLLGLPRQPKGAGR